MHTTEQAPVARARRAASAESMLSSRQIGVPIRSARRRWLSRSWRGEGLLEAEQPEPVEMAEVIDVGAGVAAVGVDLHLEGGEMAGSRLPTGSRSHPGPIFILTRAIALVGEQPTSARRAADGSRLPHHGPDGNPPALHPEHLGQGPALGPKVGVGHRHLQGGEGQRRAGRGPPRRDPAPTVRERSNPGGRLGYQGRNQ